MFNSSLHVPDHSSHIEPTAFQAQLRRLESLQTLMTQGGTVVGEVAQFLAKAREELSAFQREQETNVAVQRQLLEENTDLAAKLTRLGRAVDEANVRAKEFEMRVTQLTTQLTSREDGVPSKEVERERKRATEQHKADAEKIASLEAALKRERTVREQAMDKMRQNEAALHGAEIAQLKERLSALEQQLEVERERRSRLMEVVKVHDVTVAAQKLRQPA